MSIALKISLYLTEHLIDPLKLLSVGEGTNLLQMGLLVVFNLLGVLDREKIDPMSTVIVQMATKKC